MENHEEFDTPPPGWQLFLHREGFTFRSGPYYFREEGGAPGVGFYSKPHHANLGGVIHGGALLSLADMSLWDICRRKVGRFKGLTVTLNSEFVGPGPIGAFIEATGEMTRAGKSLLFARGAVTSEGATLLTFSGILKRLDALLPD